jgi:predicted nucleic acid-binding protein
MAKINIVDDSLINLKFKDAYCIMKAIDIKDTPFLAAALATKSDIWSDDKHFEKQNKVKVWKTKDIVVLL